MSAGVAAIVPAAGTGQRLGEHTGKPFVMLNGHPLLVHTLLALQQSPVIRWMLLVVRGADRSRAAALVKRYRLTKVCGFATGGASRAESVARGVRALPRGAHWVLVHDGARPCVTPQLVTSAVRSAKRHGAVACGLPATLTVKAVDDGGAVRLTLDRDHLWFVQTPQVFRRDWLAEAIRRACLPREEDGDGARRRQANGQLAQFPDDAALLEAAGFRVRMLPGDPLNIKVTTRDDLLLAEHILRHRTGGKVAK